MMDEDDARADDALSSMLDAEREHFKSELHHDALRGTSPAVLRIRRFIAESRKVMPVSPSGAYLLAASASEMCQRKLLFEPVLTGLIHSDFAVKVVVSAITRTSADRIHTMLASLLVPLVGIDLAQYQRAGATKPILAEAQDVAAKRNAIMHHGEVETTEAATIAIEIAEYLLDVVFEALLGKYMLRLRREDELVGFLPPETVVILHNH